MMTENIFVSKKNRSVTDAIFLFVSLERECFVSFFENYYYGKLKNITYLFLIYIYVSGMYGEKNFNVELYLLHYYMRNFCNLIGLEQWYFSLI